MKSRYYVHYYNDFCNSYNLYHAPADFVPPAEWEWQRVTRKRAEELARLEKWRRKSDPAFSHYAGTYIFPHDWDREHDDLFWSIARGKIEIDGVIIRRVEV